MHFFALASHITSVEWSKDTQQTIEFELNALAEAHEELAFYAYCLKWKIAPWIYKQLQRNRLKLSQETMALFELEHSKIKKQNTARNETALKFLKRFDQEKIEIAVLKGNYLAHAVYEDVGYKRMNDFDILIHKADWDKIQDIYLELGFIPLGFGWSGEKEKPASYSHVGMSYISPDFTCIIGSQWGLKSPTTAYQISADDIWKETIDFDFYGLVVKALSPEYNLLHLVLHLGVYKCGIRDCMDLYNLSAKLPIDFEKYTAICKMAKAESKSVFALSISNLCHSQFAVQENQNSTGFLKTRLDKRLAIHMRTGDYQNSYNDYFQDIEKQVIYFNLFPRFHNRLRYYLKILRLIYISESSVNLKLNDAADRPKLWRKFVSWLKAPYFIFSLIAQEIGWKFACLLFIKLFFDLLFSIKNYFIKTDSYFDYLREKGIDPKKMEAVVKNIQ